MKTNRITHSHTKTYNQTENYDIVRRIAPYFPISDGTYRINENGKCLSYISHCACIVDVFSCPCEGEILLHNSSRLCEYLCQKKQNLRSFTLFMWTANIVGSSILIDMTSVLAWFVSFRGEFYRGKYVVLGISRTMMMKFSRHFNPCDCCSQLMIIIGNVIVNNQLFGEIASINKNHFKQCDMTIGIVYITSHVKFMFQRICVKCL